jgi:hypothetical protein
VCVVVGQPNPGVGKGVDGRGWNQPARVAQIGVAQIVQENQQNIRGRRDGELKRKKDEQQHHHQTHQPAESDGGAAATRRRDGDDDDDENEMR